MLRIGPRSYDLVRAHSGFFLYRSERDPRLGPQHWRMELHYVPSDHDPGRADGRWEYLRFTLSPHLFALEDWRDLSKFRDQCFPDEFDPFLNHTTVENLLAERPQDEVFSVTPDELTIRQTTGYLFHCEFDGFMQWHDREDIVEFRDEIPFAEVVLRVPINVRDPVKAAAAAAAREIRLQEIERGRVTPLDWKRKYNPDATLDDSHEVVLTTPWRKHLA